MDNFERAFNFVIENEGGLSENPNDSGGITNCGISLRFLREVKEANLRRYGIFEQVNENTIRNLTLDQIKLIYKGEFWEGSGLEEIDSRCISSYIFDMVVNLGSPQAIRCVQRGICAATFSRGQLLVDGLLGERTIGNINSIGEELLPILVAIRAEFYRFLAATRPKDEVFLDGWLNRAYSLP